MKKIILASAVAAMALVSCTKEIAEVAPAAVRVNGLELVGQIAPDTKLAIGELSGDFYPLVWTAGDKIGIYNCTEGSDMKNISATLNSKSDGLNSGVFVVEDEFSLAEGVNDLIVYYPYNVTDSTKIDVAAKEATQFLISSEQKQAKANSSASLGAYSFAYATAKMDTADPDTKPSFTLQHASTYVKIVVSSSEFSSYKLERVSISDKSASPASVSGLVTVNIPDGTTSIKNGLPYAAVTVQEPATLESAQEVYLSVLPCDFTGKKAYLSFTMSKDDKTVTIPIEIDGKQLKANALNIIEVKDLKLSDNKCSWFEPVETRYLAGGWAYGESNTICLLAAADAANTTVSVKAHGDFAGACEPMYVAFNMTYQNDNNQFKNLVINNDPLSGISELFNKTNGYTATGAKLFELTSDKTFDIKCVTLAGGSFSSFGRVVVLDAAKKPIWAFNVWNMKSEWNEVNINGFTLMDRNLCGNSYEDARDASRNSCFFQWGRPFGIPWGAANVDAMTGNCMTFTFSAENCLRFIKKNAISGIDWWQGMSPVKNRAERRDNLWGNPNQTSEPCVETGVKSIFDPCPKGWMVACPKALEFMKTMGEMADNQGNFGNDVVNGNQFWMRFKYATDKYIYFPYAGLKWDEGGNPNDNSKDVLAVWTNSTASSYSSTTDGASCINWRCKGLKDGNTLSVSAGRAQAYTVRCMKDVENR